jgi:hypothetical protein
VLALAGMDPVRVKRLRELLAGWVECGDTPSVAVCVARHDVVVLHEAFGVLRHGGATPTAIAATCASVCSRVAWK